MQNWDFAKSENIDQIINEISNDTKTRNDFLEYIRQQQRIKYLLHSIIERKNTLLKESDSIHNQIISLQSDARLKQQTAKHINHLIITINNYLEDNPKINEIKDQIKDQNEIKDQIKDQNEIKDQIKYQNEIKDQIKDEIKDQNEIKEEKNNKANKIIKERKTKLSEDELRKKWLRDKSDEEIEDEKQRIINEIKKYRNVNFDGLEVVKTLLDEKMIKSTNCKSIKIMEKDVMRIKYDENNPEQVKRFHRMIMILRHLENCDMVPRLLYFNGAKLTIYIPYYGDIPDDTVDNQRQIGFLIKKLKRNWGVYKIKDGKVMNTTKRDELMMDKKGRLYIYDFNSLSWIVDKDKKYPMKN